MSKKHFIELADLFRCKGELPATVAQVMADAGLGDQEGMPELRDAILAAVAVDIACFCKRQNYNFDRERWLSYIAGECGPNGGKVMKNRKWTKGTYEIAVNPAWLDRESNIRSGYISYPFAIDNKRWDITHIPTGTKVTNTARRFKHAKDIVDRIESMADWGSTDPLKALTPEARSAIIKEIRK